ncbi:MAG TPA: acyl-CoA dehydrogenase family protein [Mycobacteriales bacterium]|nr:acyl-CoA dehydrogenase family protein [Mycobacteriales bacterium]
MSDLTADQQALVGLAADILRGRTSNEQLAKTEVSESRVDDELWRELSEAGLLGIAVPEALGGAGLGFTELCLLLEQQGRFVAPVPLWENLLAAYVLTWHGTPEQQERWLPPLAAGTTRLGLAASLDGPSPVTYDGTALAGRALVTSKADALVVVTDAGVYLCEAPAGEPVVTTNHAVAYDTDLTGVPAVALDADVESVLNHLRLGLAATALGVADAGVREAAQHLTHREQFGRPLATFQATSFQLGDAYCDVQAMRATLWQAVWAIDAGPATTETAVAAWYATDAAERVQHTVQHLHGGLGADTTYPVHRRLLWTMRTNALLGGPSRQLARLASALLAPPTP